MFVLQTNYLKVYYKKINCNKKQKKKNFTPLCSRMFAAMTAHSKSLFEKCKIDLLFQFCDRWDLNYGQVNVSFSDGCYTDPACACVTL